MSFIAGNDFNIAVARGLVSGHTAFRKFGRNPSIGAASELISTVGATLPYMPTAAVNVEVVTTGNDTAAGAGARAVTVIGLNGSFNEITEVVATNAGTATTTATFIRVYRAYVSACGTYGGTNENLITIRAATGGTTFVQIDAGEGQTETTHYCVPAGYDLYVHDFHITVDTTKACDIAVNTRENADDSTAPVSAVRVIGKWIGMESAHDFEYATPNKVSAKTDIWFSGYTATSTSAVSIEYIGVLVAQ